MPAERTRPRSAIGRLTRGPYGKRPTTSEQVTRVRCPSQAPLSSSRTIPTPTPAPTLTGLPSPSPVGGAIEDRMPWDVRLFLRDQRLAFVRESPQAGGQIPDSSSPFVLPDARQEACLRDRVPTSSRRRASSLPPSVGCDRLRRVRGGGGVQKRPQKTKASRRGKSNLHRLTENPRAGGPHASKRVPAPKRPADRARRTSAVEGARSSNNGSSVRPLSERSSNLQPVRALPVRQDARQISSRGDIENGDQAHDIVRPARRPLSDLSNLGDRAASGPRNAPEPVANRGRVASSSTRRPLADLSGPRIGRLSGQELRPAHGTDRSQGALTSAQVSLGGPQVGPDLSGFAPFPMLPGNGNGGNTQGRNDHLFPSAAQGNQDPARRSSHVSVLGELHRRIEATYQDPSQPDPQPLLAQPLPEEARQPLRELPLNVLRNGGVVVRGRLVTQPDPPQQPLNNHELHRENLLEALFPGRRR